MRFSIAMCTYNGERYLAAQLESIAAQTYPPAEIVVCDDVSTDGTLALLQGFAAHSPLPVRIYRNDVRLGPAGNFKKAIGLCDEQLVALADQDDEWLSHKLARAEQMIQQTGNPASVLYCSRLQYANTHLTPIGLSPIPHVIGFHNAVVENIATGCSVVFGSDIRRRILQADPSNMIMHDWWGYLVATAFGQVVYDPTPTVLYRQHGNNVAGWEPRLKKITHRTKSLIQRLQTDQQGMDSLNQAARFIATYPDVPEGSRQIVEELLRLRNTGVLERLKYALHSRVERNDVIENFGLKVMLLFGWH
jgi:glycosyltransferase involved in cell wall biosynthesis